MGTPKINALSQNLQLLSVTVGFLAIQACCSPSAYAQFVMQGEYINDFGHTLRIQGSEGFYTGRWNDEVVRNRRVRIAINNATEFELGTRQVCKGSATRFDCIRDDGRKVTYTRVAAATTNTPTADSRAVAELKEKLAAEERARKEAENKLAAETDARRATEQKQAAEAARQAELKTAVEAEARKQAEMKAAAEAARQAELRAAAEAEARKQAEMKAAAEADARKQAEMKAAAEAARQAELRAAAEAEARKQAEMKAAAEADARKQAEIKAAAEADARKQAEMKAAAEAARQAELRAAAEAEARKQAEMKAAAEADARKQTEMKAAAEAARHAEQRAAVEAAARRQAESDATSRRQIEAQIGAQNNALRQQEGRTSAAEREAAEARKTAEGARGVLANILLPINENPDSWMMRVSAIPIQQQQFCRIVDRFHNDLEAVYRARNDIRRNALYRQRLMDFASLLPRGEIANWVVKVVEVTQAQDGSAAVALQLPCRAMLGSDACRPNAARFSITIPKTSNIYRELERVETNDFVAISGTIILVRDGVPDRPLPEYAAYQPGTHCSAAEGGKTQDMFITDVKYLVRLN